MEKLEDLTMRGPWAKRKLKYANGIDAESARQGDNHGDWVVPRCGLLRSGLLQRIGNGLLQRHHLPLGPGCRTGRIREVGRQGRQALLIKVLEIAKPRDPLGLAEGIRCPEDLRRAMQAWRCFPFALPRSVAVPQTRSSRSRPGRSYQRHTTSAQKAHPTAMARAYCPSSAAAGQPVISVVR